MRFYNYVLAPTSLRFSRHYCKHKMHHPMATLGFAQRSFFSSNHVLIVHAKSDYVARPAARLLNSRRICHASGSSSTPEQAPIPESARSSEQQAQSPRPPAEPQKASQNSEVQQEQIVSDDGGRGNGDGNGNGQGNGSGGSSQNPDNPPPSASYPTWLKVRNLRVIKPQP